MQSLTVFARILLAPQTLQPADTVAQNKNKFRLVFWLAVVAFAIHLMYTIPEDEIIRIDDLALQLIINKTLGFIMGILLIFILWGFDLIVLSLMGLRGTSKAIRGSMAPFIFLPMVAIPAHEMFPMGMSQTGYIWIVWVIICLFIAMHTLWFGILLKQGYVGVQNAESRKFSTQHALIYSGILFLAIISCSVLLVLYLPPIFRATYEEFFWDWF